jgi:hypothetical protein
MAIEGSAGALLLRAGLIKPEQLLEAHAARQQRGGLLGRQIVRLGFVDESTLAEFYRHQLMVPLVQRDELERAQESALARLAGSAAHIFGALPLLLDADGNLTVALAEPPDAHVVDEIAFLSGRLVLRAVAKLSDIDWALVHHYGTAEEAEAADRARKERKAQQAAESVGEVITLTPPPPNDLPAPGPRDAAHGGADLDAALARLRSADGRDEVPGAIMEFAATRFRRTAFFVVRRRTVISFAARGELEPGALRQLAIPLDEPSLLREIISQFTSYRGPLPEGPFNQLLGQALGTWPTEIILVPVRIHGRVVGVLYADGPREPLADGVLELLAVEAGAAYERILKAGKPKA